MSLPGPTRRVSPLRDTIDELFRDTPLQAERLRIFSLLRDVAREADSDEEILEIVEDICKNMVPALQLYGKDVKVEDCVEKLGQACIEERSMFLMEVARSLVRRKLRGKRFKVG